MPLSNSLIAYEDVERIMDTAVENKIGLLVTFGTWGEAVSFRARCYKFRTLTQNTSRMTFPKDDPRYGASVYDGLVVLIKTKKSEEPPFKVEIRRRDATVYKTEELRT